MSFPYIIAITTKSLEIYDVYSEQFIQSLPFNIKHYSRNIISTLNKVYLLKHPPIEHQIDFLIQNHKCVEAFDLLDKSLIKKSTLIEKMLIDSGFSMIMIAKYQEAFQYFLDSNVDIRDVLSLYTDLGVTSHNRGLLNKDFIMESKRVSSGSDRTVARPKSYNAANAVNTSVVNTRTRSSPGTENSEMARTKITRAAEVTVGSTRGQVIRRSTRAASPPAAPHPRAAGRRAGRRLRSRAS